MRAAGRSRRPRRASRKRDPAWPRKAARFSLARLAAAAVGANLVYRGLSGHCSLYRRLGLSTADEGEGVRGNLGTKIERSIVVYAPPDRVSRFWRNFANLPRFMESLESVQALDAKRSHWVARGPGGVRVEWDAEIINEIPNELIAWRSTGGNVDHALASLFGGDAGARIERELQTFKRMIESGEAVA